MSFATDQRRKAVDISTTQQIQVLRPKDINAYLLKKGYKLGKVIGEGSYSKVRICVRQSPEGANKEHHRSPIACKIIDKRKASEDFVDKFLPRELEIVSRLKHPNIVSVLHVVEHLHNVFIFMDYCDKGDLLEYIKRKGFLPEDLCRHYFKQILMAVQYLHSMDLSHRDLKCENVLLTKNDHVKLSDFGFARDCRDSKTGKRILSNTYCGSAAYAAPEILQGTQYNPKLYDMWSAGCVLFIMLTGHMPFDESDVPKMLQQQLKAAVSYPTFVDNIITNYAKSFIRHLLEPDVTRRATVEQALTNHWLEMDPPETEGDVVNILPPGGRSSARDQEPRFDQGDSYSYNNSSGRRESFAPPHSARKSRRNSTATGSSKSEHADKSTSSDFRGVVTSARKNRIKHPVSSETNATKTNEDIPQGYSNNNVDNNSNVASARKRLESRQSENPLPPRSRGGFKQ